MHRDVSMRSMVMAVSLILVLTAGIASAAPVTQIFIFQGNLTNAADAPLTGTYGVTFRLYNVATGGTALATDTHAVTATKGQFTTTLNFAASQFDGKGLWVSMQRGSDPEKTLRTIIRPVPYALSLKPGAIISGKSLGSSYALNLKKTDLNGGGLAIATSGKWTYGISLNSSGDESEGIHVVVMNKTSNGIGITHRGESGNAIAVNTYGDSDEGLHVGTLGSASTGIHVQTSEPFSKGIGIETAADNSPGIDAVTQGYHAESIYSETNGDFAEGVAIKTAGGRSHGVSVTTTGDVSHGILIGVSGQDSSGVSAWSEKSNGVVAATGNASHEWGFWTDDYIYALGIHAPHVDVAEYMPVAGDISPGTVLVIGPEGKLRMATTANDPHVAGIISTTPAITLGRNLDGNAGEGIVAIAGRVPCKVDAGYGPVHPGDLLSTSRTPGYAMKASPVTVNGIEFYRDGTVLGKAMGTLESGTGTIEVLVTLQ